MIRVSKYKKYVKTGVLLGNFIHTDRGKESKSFDSDIFTTLVPVNRFTYHLDHKLGN